MLAQDARNLGIQAAFRYRAHGLGGDALRFATNEDVLRLRLCDQDEAAFYAGIDATLAVFAAPPQAREERVLQMAL